MDDAPAVRARGLVKRYGDLTAVDGVDFDVPRGATFAILGPNGAGKSSTMRMLYGLSAPTDGRLEVLGMDVRTRGREIKRRIGVVPQESNLDSDMTARENLLVFGRFYDVTGRELRRRVDDLLEYVQLSEKAHTRAWELSGGMKRRLLIARALVNDPELLVLDEPTTGLDPQSRSLLWERIRDMGRQGRTVILSTHYLEEAERLAGEMILLDKGRVVERGAPHEITRRHVSREVLEVHLEDAGQEAALRRALEGLSSHVERIGVDLVVHGESGEAMLDAVARSGVRVERASLRRATLEDAFLKLTGRHLAD